MFYIRGVPATAKKTLKFFGTCSITQYIAILAKCCCDTAGF